MFYLKIKYKLKDKFFGRDEYLKFNYCTKVMKNLNGKNKKCLLLAAIKLLYWEKLNRKNNKNFAA